MAATKSGIALSCRSVTGEFGAETGAERT